MHQLHDLLVNFSTRRLASPLLFGSQKSPEFLHHRILDAFAVTVNNLGTTSGSGIGIGEIDKIGIFNIGLVDITSHVLNQRLVKDVHFPSGNPLKQVKALV